MRIEFIRELERYVKSKINGLFIRHKNFTIISNNCWGTFIYKKYELHFVHYQSEADAEDKWRRRVKKINPKKMIFKFSDGDKFEEEMAERFDKLKFKNKVCFLASEHPKLQSVITLEKFRGTQRVHDEWKNSKKEIDEVKFINNIALNEELF